jgi:hypothetical protein
MLRWAVDDNVADIVIRYEMAMAESSIPRCAASDAMVQVVHRLGATAYERRRSFERRPWWFAEPR